MKKQNKFDTFYESIMNDAGDDFDKEPIEMIESHMAKVNLNLGMAGQIAADAASPGVDKRAGELGAEVQRQLHDFMDNFGPEEDAETGQQAGHPAGAGTFEARNARAHELKMTKAQAGIEDAESSIDNITGELNGHGRMAAESISNLFALVEDEGQEMLDKQAAEKLEDIIEFASNLLRQLNNRLD